MDVALFVLYGTVWIYWQTFRLLVFLEKQMLKLVIWILKQIAKLFSWIVGKIREGKEMGNLRRFYTVVVVEVDMFESSIVDERHFADYKEAERFKNSLSDGRQGLICEINP